LFSDATLVQDASLDAASDQQTAEVASSNIL